MRDLENVEVSIVGRWVRWFGAEEAAGGRDGASNAGWQPVSLTVSSWPVEAAAEGPAHPGGHPGVRVARRAEGMLRSAPPAPTGIISIERLPAEMLTAVLVREGALTTEDEHKSLQEHRTTGRPVEVILVDDGIIEESDLVAVLSRSCKVPHISLEGYHIRPEVLEIVPAEFARANRVIPLEKLGKILNVATSNPLDISAFGKLRNETGLNVKPQLAGPNEIAEYLDKFYPPPPEEIAPEPPPTVEEPATEGEPPVGSLPSRGRAGVEPVAAHPVVPSSFLAEEPAELLSEEEAMAFSPSPSAALDRAWEEEVGHGVESELPAVPVSEAEFALAAADEPVRKDDAGLPGGGKPATEPPPEQPAEAETETRAEIPAETRKGPTPSEKPLKTRSTRKGAKKSRKKTRKKK